MNAATEVRPLTFQDLRTIATSASPCITMLIPLETHLHALNRNGNRLTKALRSAQDQLAHRDLQQTEIDRLLDGLTAQIIDHLVLKPGAQSLVILRSPDVFQNFLLTGKWEEGVWIDDHFFVKPLLSLRDENRSFCILALSQKNIQLFRCTSVESTPIDLRGMIPESLEQAMLTKPPDRRLDRSSSGPSGATTFGTGADEDAKNEYLAHFFKMIDRGIREILRNEPIPLVLAGVNYEVCLYRKVSTYPDLVDEALIGAISNVNSEMHQKALDLVTKVWDKPADAALAEFERFSGSERVLTNMKEIVRNTREGRVSHLFVAEEEQSGFLTDETLTTQIPREAADQDLVNLAAIHALRSSSQIFTLPRQKMPHGTSLAAVLRF